MTFTAIPNGVRIVHQGLIGTSQIINTVGCQNGVSTGGDSLSSLASMHGDAWRANVVPHLAASYQHVATLAYSLEDQSLAPGDAGYTTNVPGGQSSAITAGQVCMVASLRTAKRGKTYQGRMYLSPIWDTAYASPVAWAPTAVTVMQNALNAYKAAVDPAVGDNGRMAICSRGVPGKNIPPHVEPVTGIIVRSYIGTQRRRVN